MPEADGQTASIHKLQSNLSANRNATTDPMQRSHNQDFMPQMCHQTFPKLFVS